MADSYCEAVGSMEPGDPNVYYHDHVYGYPLTEDDELFGRLILEINQAGLSWTTILKKAENFRQAFDGFSVEKIAGYGEEDIERLLQDAGIIRNGLKIRSVIWNAQRVREFQVQHGSFAAWLNKNHPQPLDSWVKLFKKHFKFTGNEITNEFLMSTGYLPNAHIPSCPVYKKIELLNPPWISGSRKK
jgi:DNA-3-methyladenine glycosylase I